MNHIVLALSGASGAIYGVQLARELAKQPNLHTHMVVSPAAQRVMYDELDLKKASDDLFPGKPENVTFHSHRDIGAQIASGSFQTLGMIVCPSSSHTVAAIAGGLGDNLITRAAMVTLKERRRMVIVPREMPFSTIELEALTKLSQNGVIICPASPGFYMRPTRIEHLVDFVVGRVLDLFNLPHDLNTRWDPGRVDDVERT